MDEDTVDIGEAARRLGVHERTAARWVREGRLPARLVEGRFEVPATAVERVRRERGQTRVDVPVSPSTRSWEAITDRLVDDLLDGDETAVVGRVRRLAEGGVPAAALCDLLLAPALREVGEHWASGRCGVAEEHRASAICERALARVPGPFGGRPRGSVVAAVPSGEGHLLPSLMAAVALRSARWQVHHLGHPLPVDDLVRFAAECGAGLVVLSVTVDVDGAVAASEALEAAGLAVLAGRPGRPLSDLLALARRGQEGTGGGGSAGDGGLRS